MNVGAIGFGESDAVFQLLPGDSALADAVELFCVYEEGLLFHGWADGHLDTRVQWALRCLFEDMWLREW
jgi:hypothetical protein